MEAVAAGRVFPNGRPTLVVVGDDEHVEVVDRGAESRRGVVASELENDPERYD